MHNAAGHSGGVGGPGGPFHFGGPGTHPFLAHHPGLGESPSSLYQPLRACNRSLTAAAMSSLLPQQFSNMPLNPLQLYNLQRDLAVAAASHPHHPAAATHPLLARYHSFMHPRFPRKYAKLRMYDAHTLYATITFQPLEHALTYSEFT
jgi:hypothetical protein